MLIAKPWYESGSFWQFAISMLVAVAVGALGAFATMRAANPKRRLSYRAHTNAPLFIASDNQTEALQVTYNGTPVSRPRICELEIRNSGRRDITATHFHGGEALKFDLGADAVGVLGVTSSPSGTVVPAVDIDATDPHVVAIPPTLLTRKQVVRATFLVDGPRAEMRCIQAPLVDVDIREDAIGPEETVVSKRVMLRMANALVLLLSAVSLALVFLLRVVSNLD
jgi:hypothetical protein